jgi:hypothetical protein
MKVGDIGHLSFHKPYQMTVTQVFEKQILVSFVWKVSDYRFDRSGTFFVIGIDTKGLVSDARWEPPPDDIFEVTGTKTYETVAGGSKTVFVLSKMNRKGEQAGQKASDSFAELPEEVAKYARARQADEAYLSKRLREWQVAVAETSGRIHTPADKAALSAQLQARQANVADLKQRLQEVQEDANIRPLCGPTVPVWHTEQRLVMKVGDIGRFPSFQTSVAQVFKNKILVNYDWGRKIGARSADRSGTFLVKGIDTTGLVSGGKWRPSQDDVFEVTGTETYETVAGGTRTVLALSPVRADRIKAYLEAKAAEARAREEKAQAEVQKEREAEEQRKANAEKARWHTWSDSDGTSQFEARVIGISNGNVVLKKRDDTITRIPLEKLSADDQEWLEQWKKLRTKHR